MLILKLPLGPKGLLAASPDGQVEAGHDHYADPGPFEWPKRVSLASTSPTT